MRPRARRSLSLLLGLSMAVGFASGAFADGNGANVDGMHILRVRGASPFGSGPVTNLQYNGGSIQATPKVYISWWGTAWSTGFSTGGYSSAQAQTYVTSFFGGVGGSSWNNSVTQYCQGTTVGSTSCSSSLVFVGNKSGMLAGTWNDTAAVPARPKQSDIAAAAARLAAQFGGVQAGATYFVFTPTGQSMTGFGTRWCAWHSSSSQMAYAYMPYIPDAGTNCGMNFVNPSSNSFGNGYFDGFSVVGGHEMAEAETDPFPNTGWLDSSGSENGDKCAWNSSSGNISLGSNSFAVQPLWSNASIACVMSY